MSCGTSQERGQEERNRQREESPLPFSSACNVSGLPSHSPSTEKLGTRSSLGGGFVSGSWMKSLLVEGRLWGGWPSAPSATPRHFPWPRGVWKHETITQQSRGLSTCPPWTRRSRGVASIEETFFSCCCGARLIRGSHGGGGEGDRKGGEALIGGWLEGGIVKVNEVLGRGVQSFF